jgi:hypothetical protein
MRKLPPVDDRDERDLPAQDPHGWSQRNSQGNVIPHRRYLHARHHVDRLRSICRTKAIAKLSDQLAGFRFATLEEARRNETRGPE